MIKRTLSVLLLAAVPAGFLAGEATAQPDPTLSDVPSTITLSPGPIVGSIGTYTVVVRNAASVPIVGSLVEITFNPLATARVCWCSATGAPTKVSGLTGPGGVITFNFYGGGCFDATVYGAGAAVVTADGVILSPSAVGTGDISMASPDVVDAAGLRSWMPGYVTGPPCEVSLADAVDCTKPIKLGLVDACCDLAAPFGGPIGLADAVALTPYVKFGSFCP